MHRKHHGSLWHFACWPSHSSLRFDGETSIGLLESQVVIQIVILYQRVQIEEVELKDG
jgi:hypothetical protein